MKLEDCIKVTVTYPRVVEAGGASMLTIDVRMEATTVGIWHYPEEEYPITCILETGELFRQTVAGGLEPVLLLHRFGRTYGPVRFLLTATDKPSVGHLIVMLVNAYGTPLDSIVLPCKIVSSMNESR